MTRDFSFRRQEEHGSVIGTTTVGVGCQTCPNRQEITIQTSDNINLQMDPMVPVSIGRSLIIQGSKIKGAIDENFGINQQPCENQCPYGNSIKNMADNLRAQQFVVDATFNPREEQF